LFTSSHLPAPEFSSRPDLLSAGYAELKIVDEALRDAEQRLQAAHRQFALGLGKQPDGLYCDVVLLRQRSRRMLDALGDLFYLDNVHTKPA
jgi:hypothetical protein